MSLNEQQKEKIGLLFDIINKLRDERNGLIWDCGFSTDDWDNYSDQLIEIHDFFFKDNDLKEKITLRLLGR